jgi:hypothetical protein
MQASMDNGLLQISGTTMQTKACLAWLARGKYTVMKLVDADAKYGQQTVQDSHSSRRVPKDTKSKNKH